MPLQVCSRVVGLWGHCIGLLIMLVLSAGCSLKQDQAVGVDASKRERIVQTYIQLGLAYIASGNIQRAKARLDHAFSINPNVPLGNAAMGRLWEVEGKPSLAEDYYRRALQMDPGHPQVNHMYGLFLLGLKRSPPYCPYLSKASDTVLYEVDVRLTAHVNLADCLTAQGKKRLSAAVLQRAHRLYPKDPMLLVQLAQIYYDRQHYVESDFWFGRFKKLVDQQHVQHSAKTTWLGIQLAHHFERTDEATAYVALMERAFRNSQEYGFWEKASLGIMKKTTVSEIDS